MTHWRTIRNPFPTQDHNGWWEPEVWSTKDTKKAKGRKGGRVPEGPTNHGVSRTSQPGFCSPKYRTVHALGNRTTHCPRWSCASETPVGRLTAGFTGAAVLRTPPVAGELAAGAAGFFSRSQRTMLQGADSRRQSAPYSDSRRYFKTSNCSGPTAPRSGTRCSESASSYACATPSFRS